MIAEFTKNIYIFYIPFHLVELEQSTREVWKEKNLWQWGVNIDELINDLINDHQKYNMLHISWL